MWSSTAKGLGLGAAAGLAGSGAGSSGLLGDVGDALSAPRRWLWEALGLPSSGHELMENTFGMSPGFGSHALGMGAEILGDPLTYLPMGLGALGGKAASGVGAGARAVEAAGSGAEEAAPLMRALSEGGEAATAQPPASPPQTVVPTIQAQSPEGMGPYGFGKVAAGKEWELKDKFEAAYPNAGEAEIESMVRKAIDDMTGEWAVMADSQHASLNGVHSRHATEAEAFAAMMRQKQRFGGTGINFGVEHRPLDLMGGAEEASPLLRAMGEAAPEAAGVTSAAAEAAPPTNTMLDALTGGPKPLGLPAPTPPFYSRLQRALEEDPGQQYKTQGFLQRLTGGKVGRQGPINQEEIEHTGLGGLLEGKSTIGKNELLEHLGRNGLKVSPTVLGEEGGPAAKWAGYQTPGSENYKETLLRLPVRADGDAIQKAANYWQIPAEQLTDQQIADAARLAAEMPAAFQSKHFEEPNILAHLRTNERTLPGGGRLLHAEEIQSDWHQIGKEKGYATQALKDKAAAQSGLLNERNAIQDEMNRIMDSQPVEGSEHDMRLQELLAKRNELGARIDSMNAPGDLENMVPDAPFKQAWPDLALKQLLHDAAAGGFDRTSWNTGKQIHGMVGGGLEGQQQFYDQALPAKMNKLLKALGGGQVESIGGLMTSSLSEAEAQMQLRNAIENASEAGTLTFPHGHNAEDILELERRQIEQGELVPWRHYGLDENVMHQFMPRKSMPGPAAHSVQITPELRKAILKGMPLLSAGGLGGGALMAALQKNQES